MTSLSKSVEMVGSHQACWQPTAPDSSGSPRALWIACSERVMDVPLARVQQYEAIAICRQFGGCAEARGLRGERAAAAILRAVESEGVREIVVCGHSGCEAFHGAREPGDRAHMGRVPSLVERVRMREDENVQLRARLVEQIQWLREIPAVRNAIARGELHLRAVFYLVEAGLFVEVDPATGEQLSE